jgi:cob(I)alamin adenosyltransferase
MRIYTKTGDDGTTGLFGGARVAKTSLRVEAYGTVDELNSVIGLTRAEAPGRELDDLLNAIQDDLLCLGAEIATVAGKESSLKSRRIGADAISRLEAAIDDNEASLAPLQNFILPGGARSAAVLHLARTVCRRAERRLLAAAQEGPLNGDLVVYLNRLSDLLFVLARRANQLAGVKDVVWAPRSS